MKVKSDHIVLGILLGLICPIAGMIIYYFYSFSGKPFTGFLNVLIMGGGIAPLISLCCICNLAVFFLFLNKEKYQTVKGIIFATILYGIAVMILKIDSLF